MTKKKKLPVGEMDMVQSFVIFFQQNLSWKLVMQRLGRSLDTFIVRI